MSVGKESISFHTVPLAFDSFKEKLNTFLEASDPLSFRHTYLKKMVFSKFVDDSSVSKESRRTLAIEKWSKVETSNARTNVRIAIPDDEHRFNGVTRTVGDMLSHTRATVARVIGNRPPSWLRLSGGFGNGAGTQHRREAGVQALRYLAGTHITERAVPHFLELLRSREGWYELRGFKPYDVVPGNVLFTVPKSSEIDRCAAKEPDLNLYLQKCLGNYFRSRLMTIGVNLNDQSVNRAHAQLGSISGDRATLDLSSASDTLCTSLVYLLLPFEWCELLMDIRSPYTLVDGVWHENQMISSMGNGFTFELESLIFWALTRTACWAANVKYKGRLSVYGDDIICPTEAVKTVITYLSWCGFRVNKTKSHYKGRFRESCGGHYLHGRDVKPFYIRKVALDVPAWIKIANQLREWLASDLFGGFIHEGFPLWCEAAKNVPGILRGGWDTSRVDILVSTGNLRCKVGPKQVHLRRKESELQTGLYLQWLDAADTRKAVISERETRLVRDGALNLSSATSERSLKRSFGFTTPWFLEEVDL